MTEITTDSGLRYSDIKTGDGETATGRGQTAIVHYTGWLEDDTKFDSSRDRNEPFSFPMACGYVIPGWDEGVKGMQVGGIRRLVIPAALGYGAQGAGGVIPPNATLTFEIELLELSTWMLLDVLDENLLHTVRAALDEDIGSGDITAALVPRDQTANATVICRETAMVCGQAWFNAVFAELDSRISISWLVHDGDMVRQKQTLCTLSGPARPLLTGERTALNFLQTLSATATRAHQYAETIADLPTRILDTRKTIPGLRHAQKYAVRVGGCDNHRSGLYDGILIKENHIAAAGSINKAVRHARDTNPEVMVAVEVEDSNQLQQALAAGADRLLLDNFTLPALAAAVKAVAGRTELEASGGITLENLRETARTGVDFISIGALTKDIHAIDLSMIFDVQN